MDVNPAWQGLAVPVYNSEEQSLGSVTIYGRNTAAGDRAITGAYALLNAQVQDLAEAPFLSNTKIFASSFADAG